MPNHYHLLLGQQEGGSISRFLQTTFNAYVHTFNLIENHSGTIFQGAARGIQIQNEESICRIVPYIHHNPVAARFVKSPELWKFSDYSEWIGKRQFRFDGKDILSPYFENSQEYAEFMKRYQVEKTLSAIESGFSFQDLI
jgi:hypothetical protein